MESFLSEHALFAASLGASVIICLVRMVFKAIVLALFLGAVAAGVIIHHFDKWDHVAGLFN